MAQAKSAASKTKAPARPRRSSGARPAATTSKPKSPDIPALEWVSAAIGLVATLGLIGVIGWEALKTSDTPPSMRLTLQKVVRVEGGYVAAFEVTNRGERPAAQVVVEGALTAAGAAPEVAEATFDYVPDGSTRAGGLFFETDPRSGVLKLRAKGFVEP